jgi:3-deoxy-D-manno-octulosonate 8-phosphate phosphatase (KDO 8-P phosphatase)
MQFGNVMRRKKFPVDKAKKVKLLIIDVDGVLTDGRIILGSGGEEFKNFHVQDGTGIRLALRAGLKIAVISARKSAVTRIRAKELGISELWQVEGSKEKIYEKLRKKYDLTHSQIAYIGDDVYDVGIMKKVGLAAAVSNAVDEVKRIAHYVTGKSGGYGAVREVIDFLLKSQKKRVVSFISALLLISCLWVSSCSNKAEVFQTRPYPVEEGERIEGGFSYTATEGGKVIFEVEGERATGLSGDAVNIEKPEVKWYSSNGLAEVKADKGVLMRNTEEISFEGDVSVISTWGRMSCDELDWIASEKKMTARGNAKGEFYLQADELKIED